MRHRIGYVILLLFAETCFNTLAQQPSTCSQSCSGLTSKFKYNKGSSYTYKYDSQTKIQLVGNSKNVATVGLEGSVTISVVDTCEFVLKLSGVKITGPSAAQVGFDLAKDLEKSPLAFSFDNGAVRNICPAPEDTIDALNIKRAILSSFQVANDFEAEDGYETDISGHCPVKHVKESGGSFTKKKNLLECRNHLHFESSMRVVPYNVRSHFQSVPALKANQACQIKIDKNVLKESVCTESHEYLPFRNEKSGSGITASVSSKLTFGQEGKSATPAPVGKIEPLIYDNRKVTWKESKEGVAQARDTLKLLCQTASNDARPDTASHFVELVYELKATTLDDLKALAKEAKSPPAQCPKFRQFFIDAVAQCGATPCVSLLTELLTTKSGGALPSLTRLEEKLALGNLALTAHPTKPMVAAVTKVLSDFPRQGLFAATALVNNYCRLHPHCEEEPEIKAFAQKYVGIISGLKLSENGPDNVKAVEALRAFGNLGYLSDGIKERLNLLDQKAHIDAKLAVVQSLRRVSCSDDVEEKLFAVYSDNKQEVEVRIQAFLVLMNQCVDKALISRIVNATDDIKSNQVGSFVQSYFDEIRASQDPTRNKNLFSRARLTKKFPGDPRKYSRFYESSKFNHETNQGYHIDTSLIYTPQGVFPKQISVNFSMDYFGNEVNLAEFGLRLEHLDEIYDNLFGPEGYVTNAAAAYEKEGRKIEVKNPKLAEFQNAFNKNKKPSTGLDIGAYGRVFGDEVFYTGGYNVPVFDQVQKLFLSPGSMLNKLAKEKTYNFAINRLPFDHQGTVPAISGFPLRFDVNGSVVLSVDFVNQVNVNDIPRGNAEVKFTFKPSASVETAFLFGIYTGAVKNGVRFSRKSHSSTALSFNLKLANRDTLTAKLDLPKERQELAKVETRLETIINNVPIDEKGITENRGEGAVCSPKKLSERIGLKLCTKISYPNASHLPDAPYFPFTGPFDAELYIDKADPGVTGYELNASWKANKNGRDVIVSFDTPNSKINRKVSLTANYERQKSINVEYKSPKRQITAKGKLEGAGPDNTAATISVGVDANVYEVKANVIRSSLPDNGRKYVVKGEVKGANRPSAGNLEGSLEVVPGKKLKIDGTITKLFDNPITYKALYEKSPGKYVFDDEVKGPWGERHLKGDVTFKSIADLSYSYDFEKKLPQEKEAHKFSYSHNHKFARLAPSSYQLDASAKFTCSKYPTMNGGYVVHVEKKPEKFALQLNTTEGGQPGLTFEQLTAIKPKDYSTSLLIRYPKAKVHDKISLVYRNNLPKEFEASVKVNEVDAKKDMQAIASLKKTKDPNSYEGEYLLHLKLPAGEYKAFKTVKAPTPNSLESETVIQWPPNKKAEFKSTLTGKPFTDYELKSTIKLPDSDPLDYQETVKAGGGGYKWTGILKKAGKVLFDAGFDLAPEVQKKRNLKSRIKLPNQNVDIGIDGLYEPLPLGHHVLFTTKKNDKDYTKLDVVAPLTFRHDQNKQAKWASSWDLDTPEPKEIGFDIKTEVSGKVIEHEANFALKTPKADYKFELKRRHNDQRSTNFTIYKSTKPIVKLSVGRLYKQVGPKGVNGLFDVYLQTLAPMTPRDLSGRLSFEYADPKYKANLLLSNKLGNRQIGFDAEGTTLSGPRVGYDKSVKFIFDDNEINAKNRFSTAATDKSDIELVGQLSANDKTKKATNEFKWDIKKTANKLDAEISLPSPKLKKITFNGQKDEQPKKRSRKVQIAWDKNKVNVDASMEFELQGDQYAYSKRVVNLDSTFEAVKALKYEFSQDYRKGIDAAFNFELNKLNKFGVNYLRTAEGAGGEKWNSGLALKLGKNVDWETSSSATWNQNAGKYATKNLVRTAPGVQYKADLDLDTKSMEAKVNLENVPGIKGPIKGQAKKLSGDEYEVALIDSAGANQGKIIFKLTTPSQKVRLETGAFKAGIETEWSNRKWSVAGDLVPDAKANKAYTVQLSADSPDQYTRHSNIEIGYPERKLAFGSKRTKKPDGSGKHVLEINPNAGKRDPTKIDYSFTRSPTGVSGEFHLTDPSIPAGLHVTSKYNSQGDPQKDKSSSLDVSVKYSADPKKELTLKKSSQRQTLPNGFKTSSSYELNHEASNLKHKVWSNAVIPSCPPNSKDCELSLAFGTQFPDDKRQIQEYSLDLKRSEKDFVLLANAGSNKYKINRRKVGGQCTYDISKNDKLVYNIVTQFVRVGQPIALISIVKQPEDKVIFLAEASIANGELATLKLNHDENGQLVKDIEASLWLQESNRLALKLYKRKDLADALTAFAKKYTPVAKPAEELVPVVKTPQAVGLDIAKELKPLIDSYDKEEDKITAELQLTSGKLSAALGDEVQSLNEAVNYGLDLYDSGVRTASARSGQLIKDYKEGVNSAISKLPEATSNIGASLRDAKTATSDRFARIQGRIKALKDDISKNEKVNNIIAAIIKFYNDISKGTYVQKLRNVYKDVKSRLDTETAGKGIASETLKDLQGIKGERLKALSQMWEQVKAEWSKDEDYKELIAFFDQVNAKLQWAVNYAEPLGKGHDAFGSFISGLTSRKKFEPYVFYKSPDGLTYNLELELPEHYNSLKDLGEALTPDSIAGDFLDAKESIENILDSVYSGGGDDSDDLLGKKESTALLIGEQNLITFDGDLRSIAADCSYLLARDFKDSKFSVSVEYEKAARKKITVEYENDKIDILYDGKVTVNGKNVDLPWQVEDSSGGFKIKVDKHDDYITKLESFDGLKIECNSFNNICAVKLKNRFRGQTNGLLGRNDGESASELFLPDSSSVKSLDDFLSAWALNPSCAKSPNKARSEAPAPDHPAFAECQKLFGDGLSSPFRRCPQINFGQFLAVCAQNAKKFAETERDPAKQGQGVCQTAAAYLQACPQSTDLPSQCLQCDIPGGKLNLHETKEISGPQLKDVDVIFAIELRECISSVKSKLAGLAQKIEANLKSSGSNVRFGIVGFNGKGGLYQQNFFSSQQNQVSFPASAVKSVTDRLSFVSKDKESKSPQNPLDTIDHIVEHYPFKPASKKVLIVLSCSNCVTLELDYYDLHTKLLSQGISLHLVTTQKIELSGEGSGSFIGFDASSFIKSDLKEDVNNRKFLFEPHDSCTVLAQETNGTVFSIAEKNNINPVFDALANGVTQTAQRSQCSVCECQMHDLFPKSACFVCQVPQPAVMTSDRTGFFNNPFQKLAKLQQKE